MALTVVPESKSTGQMFAQQLATGLGSELGQAAGKGIGAGLGALGTGLGQMTGLVEKPKQLTEDMFIKAGFTKEDAQLIVNSPPALQAKLIDAISQRPPAEQQAPQEQPQELPQEISPDDQGALQPERVITTHPAVQSAMDKVAAKSGSKSIETRPSALFRPTKQEVNRLEHVSREDKKIALQEKKMEQAEKIAERKQSFAEEKEERKEMHLSEKESKAYYSDLKDRNKGAIDNNLRLSRQKEKIKEGKLVGPGLYKLMKSMGIPLDPNSAEFEKLTNDYLKNAKATFGARLTDFDVRTFLSTVPSLETSDAAKLYVINNLELLNEATIAENKAMTEIIKENGGRRPHNLEDLVEERTKDIKDDIAKRFKEGLKDIPEESWVEWAKRVGTGPVSKAIGTVGGAALGSLLGPGGSVAGATIGSGALGSIGNALGKLISK